jgi:hypothetical protein
VGIIVNMGITVIAKHNKNIQIFITDGMLLLYSRFFIFNRSILHFVAAAL